MKFVIKLLFLFLLAVQANAQTLLRFQTQVTPHAQYLGDVLLITNDINNWAKIPLDSKPKAKEQITKNQMINWLKNKTTLTNYAWRGKKRISVKQLSKTSGEALLRKAQSALRDHLEEQHYNHIELTSKTKPNNSEYPLSAFTVQIPTIYPPTKQVCVRLTYQKHSIPIWFTVKAYQTVLVTRHPIKSHTIVHESDLMLKKRNIAGLKDTPFTAFPQTVWLKKSVNKNQILTKNHLTTVPQIVRGDTVHVTVTNHGISIVAEAIAQNDGYTGQLIRMKNPQTNKYFLAMITAPNQAEVSS